MGRTIYLELVASSRMAADLGAGGVFVQDKTLALLDTCMLIAFNDGGQLELPAKVVYVDGNGGVGLELVGFDAALKAKLADLIAAGVAAAEAAPADASTEACEPTDATPEPARTSTGDIATADAAPTEPAQPAGPAPVDPVEAADDASGEEPPDEIEGTDEERKEYKSLHERLRGLTLQEQMKRAREGDPTERMLLERMYGKNVWEALLRNPRLTAPEVARIARMGTLPRPQVELIVNNGGWLQVPEVRRALLSNARLGVDQIMRVLRLMSKNEIKLASVQTAYTFAVRDAAKRMLKESMK